MGYFNIIQFRKETKRARTSLVGFAFYAAMAKFRAAKDKLQEDFEEHAVTQEIRGEIGASNITQSLGGRPNLYGFIGFEAGESNPMDDLWEHINEKVNMSEKARVVDAQTMVFYAFEVTVPSLQELARGFPYPSEKMPGSWLTDIETGIPGLTRYIYWRLNSPKSRSGLGLQAKHWDLRNAECKPVAYLTSLFGKFLNRFSVARM